MRIHDEDIALVAIQPDGKIVIGGSTSASLADFMAARLAKLGWRYIVVDIEWSEPQQLGPDYPVHSKSEIDAFGRFVPVWLARRTNPG